MCIRDSFIAAPISDGLSFVLTAIFLGVEYKKLDQKHLETFAKVNMEVS